MTLRAAAVLFALAVPVLAQEPQQAAPENLFYKAYWLEQGERDFAGAMVLYEKFLAAAPDHALSKHAATHQFELLTKTGKTKEAEAFAQKHARLLGSVAVGAPARPGRGDAEGDAPRGEGERGNPRGDAPRGGDAPDMQARLAELKKQLEEAKASGDDEQVARLERQIQRMEQAAQGGGQGRGPGGRRGGAMGLLRGDTKVADMTEEQRTQLQSGLAQMQNFVDRMPGLTDEQKKQLADDVASLEKALAAKKLDEAQAALDKVRKSLPARRGGGGD